MGLTAKEQKRLNQLRSKAGNSGSKTTSVGVISQGTAAIAGAVVVAEPINNIVVGIRSNSSVKDTVEAAGQAAVTSIKQNWQIIGLAIASNFLRPLLNKKRINPKILELKKIVNINLV